MEKLWLLPLLSITGLFFATACEDNPATSSADQSPETDVAPTEKISVLLVDGQNNHRWMETSPMLVRILEDSGHFVVTVSTSPPAPPRAPRKPKNATPEQEAKFAEQFEVWKAEAEKIKADSAAAFAEWRPVFSDYEVVISNYNGERWPKEVETAFEEYVAGGGGFVVLHAANNAFPDWTAYNEMIGLGGWGGRNELSGPYLRLRDGEWTRDMTPGRGGAHGRQHEYVVESQTDHPIVAGLPKRWLHVKDELYDRLRGPANNIAVIAAALASEDTGGSGEWEPVLMTLEYEKGLVFHTVLGDNANSMNGLGFQETLLRGTEWAARGEVSLTGGEVTELSEQSAALGSVLTGDE
ncbi:MAG: ThuA domain-containing protein [Verrucomicrobiota bacterium]